MTRSSSSSGRINIALSARKLDVNNRIPLRFYNRIANSILKQADIFREEGNLIDLYIMLLRFSSLVSETIPCHREYKTSLQSDKNYLRKKLVDAIHELEKIKPDVKRKIEDSNKKQLYQANKFTYQHQNSLSGSSFEWPPATQQCVNGYTITKGCIYQVPRTQQFPIMNPINGQYNQITFSLPRAKEETLSKHSIFGPNGLHGTWQPPASDKGVWYPSDIDFSPIEILSNVSIENPVEDKPLIQKQDTNLELEKLKLESGDSKNKESQKHQVEEPDSLISFEAIDNPSAPAIIRQPSPPPVLADVQDLIPTTPSPAVVADCGLDCSSPDGLVQSQAPLEMHISTILMDSFMRLAKSNTDKNLETCGVLAGSLKNRKFCVTALIIPKQESTSDSCQTTHEEEIFEVQDKQSLFPLGWIHTHPTQSCFMSSIDVHTHFSYQIMLPEAISIVMAPRDNSRNHGIFRLTTGGMTVIRQCPRRGFHAHDPLDDGGPIYKQCTDVYIDPNLKFDVIDLR